MSLASAIGKIFGTKADRDMKPIKPILAKILAQYEQIDKLSNDELRARSAALRKALMDCEEPFEKRIAQIKEEIETASIEDKEKLAGESDKLVKEEDAAIEAKLNEILPEAFAIVKSTARRFKENEFTAIRILLTGKLAGLEPDTIRERLRDAYV